MKSTGRHYIQVRLFLHAVFPALDGVIKASPKAQALLRDQAFSFCFRTRSGISASYFLSESGCEYLPRGGSSAGIELMFLSDRQAVANFFEQTALPPIPLKGFSGLGRMKIFLALTEELQTWLKPNAKQLQNELFREVFFQMSIGLAMRAVAQLGKFERGCRDLVASGPQGVAAFQIGESGEPMWIHLTSGEMAMGQGEPSQAPDVRVIFRNSMIAALALQNKVDSMAAIGNGDMIIRGLVPLADHLNALMERVQPYIDPEKASA